MIHHLFLDKYVRQCSIDNTAKAYVQETKLFSIQFIYQQLVALFFTSTQHVAANSSAMTKWLVLSLVFLFILRLRFPSHKSIAQIVTTRYGKPVLKLIRKFENH